MENGRDETTEPSQGAPAWPVPADVEPLPFGAARDRELVLEAAPEAPLVREFAAPRLGARRRWNEPVEVPPPSGKRATAVAYDRRFAPGRDHWTAVFDTDDADFRRRRLDRIRGSAVEAAVVLGIAFGSLSGYSMVGAFTGATVGALVGALTELMMFGALLTSLVFGTAGLVSSPLLGLLFVVPTFVSWAIGWLLGFTRSYR